MNERTPQLMPISRVPWAGSPFERYLFAIIFSSIAIIEDLQRQLAELKGGRPGTENTPPSTIPPYQKPHRRQSKKRPGRKPGTTRGSHRPTPQQVDQVRDHTLNACPRCQGPLSKEDCCEVKVPYTEDVRIERSVTEDRIHYYRCPDYRGKVHDFAEALPKVRLRC